MAGLNATRIDPLRNQTGRDARGNNAPFRNLIAETGAYSTGAVRAQSATELYTTALQKQDLTMKQAWKNHSTFNEVLKEQYRLKRMSAMTWSSDLRGRVSADVLIPRHAPDAMTSYSNIVKGAARSQISFREALDMSRMRAGLFSEVIRSAGLNMVNLGKNTQWAGRQMMVGISIPLFALGAGSAMIAYNVEKELTRVARVYDITSGSSVEAVKSSQEAIKKVSLQTARDVANGWGMAVEDTLDIVAQLAATGQTGPQLQADAKAIAELSVMGELDRQDAIKAGITLNTVFGDSILSLADQYKYLNMLENQTVVSAQDMVVAIPKVAMVVKSLGGSVTDVGTMMAAARGAGIAAGEAGNALKSIAFRQVAPTDKALRVFKELTKVDFQSLIDQTNGQVIPMMKEIQKATADLSKTDRVKVFREIQGLWQGNKAMAIGNQFFDVDTGEMSEQVKRAVEVAEGGAEEWGEVWDREARTLQQSLPNRFKRAVEGAKAELAEIGKPFLEIGIVVLNFITKVLKGFTGLDEGTKKFIMWVAIATAIIGPIVMLTGVFMNLFGTMVKGFGSIGMFLTRFRSVNQEQQVAAIMAKQAAGKFLTEAEAAQVLAASIARVNTQLNTLIMTQRGVIAGNPALKPGQIIGPMPPPAAAPRGTSTTPIGGVYQSPGGAIMQTNTTSHRRAATASAAQLQASKAMAHQQAIIQNRVENTRRAMAGVNLQMRAGTQTGLAMAGMMGMMAAGTNKWVLYISMALMMLPLLIPILNVILTRIKAIVVWMAGGRAGSFVAGIGKAIKGLAALAPALGPLAIGIAAAAGAWLFFNQRAKKAREEAEKVANAGDRMAEAMGKTPAMAGQWVNEAGENVKNYIAVAEDFKKNNKEVMKSLEDLNRKRGGAGLDTEQGKPLRDAVMKIGMDVYSATGDAKAAHQAVQAALQAMGEIELAVTVKTEFESDQWATALRQELSDSFAQKAVNLRFNGSLEDDALVAESKETAERLAESLNKGLSGQMDPSAVIGEWRQVGNSLTAEMDKAIKGAMGKFTKADKEFMIRTGVDPTSVESIRQAFISNEKFRNSLTNANADTLGLKSGLNGLKGSLGGTVDTYRRLSIETAKKTKLDQNQKVNGYDLLDMSRYLDSNLQGLTNANKAAGAAAEGTADALDTEAAAADGAAASIATVDRAIQAAKSKWEGAWGATMDFAQDQAEKAFESRMDDIQKSGERRSKELENKEKAADAAFDARGQREDKQEDARRKDFDNRWKATTEAAKRRWKETKKAEEEVYDARIQKVKDAIKVEQDAEALRQRIFEAEQRRIQRMAELYSQNIDFNVALNSGDLDEAARIGANSIATTEGWATEDAARGSEGASEARIRAHEANIELIEKEKTARMEALDAAEEAEVAAMERQKEREQEALEAHREMLRARLDADRAASQANYDNQKANLDQNQRDKEAAETRKSEATKRSLDMDLLALQQAVPRNQAEMNQYVANLEGVYKKHGIYIDTSSKQWAKFLTDAVVAHGSAANQTLKTEIDWAATGRTAAEEFIFGAFGITLDQWVAKFAAGSGINKPQNGAVSPTGKVLQDGRWRDPNRTYSGRHDGGEVFHGGGMPGINGRVNPSGPAATFSGSRTGYPASAPRRPSEVDTRLQVGEFVVQKQAVQNLGLPFMRAVNAGVVPSTSEVQHTGGLAGGVNSQVGVMGVAGGMMAAMLATTLRQTTSDFTVAAQQAQAAAADASAGDFAMPPGGFLPGSYQSKAPFRQGSGLVTGDVQGLRLEFIRRLASWSAAVGKPYNVGSGYRSLQEQAYLYDRWIRGVPGQAKAAKPGSSNHNFGLASDGPYWRGLNPGAHGLRYPMSYEPWHVEPTGAVSMRHEGGEIASSMTKGLAQGGYTLNDGYAKLHAREAVLTAPLTSQLERGIGNLDRGTSTQYNVKVDLRGAMVREEIDIDRAVRKGIEAAKQEEASRLGRNRRIR